MDGLESTPMDDGDYANLESISRRLDLGKDQFFSRAQHKCSRENAVALLDELITDLCFAYVALAGERYRR